MRAWPLRPRAAWWCLLLAMPVAHAWPIFSRVAPPDKPLLVQLKGDLPGLGKSAIGPGDPKMLVKYRSAFGTVEDKALVADLNAVLARVQGAWPGEPPPARVHVIPDRQFDARTYEGGDIFVAAGMLQSMESEDEIAALLSHEYSHVLLGHAHESKLDKAASGVFAGAMLYAMYRSGQKPDSNAFLRQFGVATLAMETVSSGLVPAMTRKEEDAADRLGMDLMIRAGYNPVAMGAFLERQADWEARDAAAADARKASAARLEDAIRTESNGQVKLDLAPVANAIVENIGNGLGKLRDKLRRQHADANERRDNARNYLRLAHADAERPALSPLPWVKQKQVQALFAGLVEANEVWERFASDERPDPKRLERLRKTPAASAPFARFLLVTQDAGTGFAALEREAATDDSLLRAHLAYIDVVGGRDHERAVAAYERAHAVFGDDPQLQPYAVRFAPPKPGNPALASLCDSLKGDLKATCQSVAKGG